MKRFLVVPLLLAIAPSVVFAQSPPPLTSKEVKVERRDSNIARYFPDVAVRQGIAGQADVLCTIKGDGGMAECVVTGESPAGLGFGLAVLKFSSTVGVSLVANDGSPTPGRKFFLHMTFGLPR